MDNGPMQCHSCGTKRDFAIHVGTPPQAITFHQDKNILCRHSEVFSTMIQSDFKEGSEGKVTITDFQPRTVRSMLRFLNTGKLVGLNWIELVDLVKLAHQFQVRALTEACEKRLAELLILENVYTNLDLASLLNLQTLRKKCLDTIAITAFISLRTPEFACFSRQDVWDVVSSDDLMLDTEMTLVEALWQWGKSECRRQGLNNTDENICTTLGELTATVCQKDLEEHEINRMSPALRDSLTKNEARSRSINFMGECPLLPYCRSITLKGDWTYPLEESCKCNLLLIRFMFTKPVFLTGMKVEFSCTKNEPLNYLLLYHHTPNGSTNLTRNIRQGTPTHLHRKGDWVTMKAYVKFVPPVRLTALSMLELEQQVVIGDFIWPKMKVSQRFTKCLDDSNELVLLDTWVRGVKKIYTMPV